ncbi:MAG: hypothetical protein WD534_15170 [Phycisphaeraceae bacterium]
MTSYPDSGHTDPIVSAKPSAPVEQGAVDSTDADGGEAARHEHRPVRIYASELSYLAGLSADYPDCETGGDVFGFYSRGGQPTIMLVGGPGPEALHQPSFFRQDLTFHERLSADIWERFALQPVGAAHSHHQLGLQGLSDGDRRATKGLARRNNLRQWIDLLTTHEVVDGAVAMVRVHCYLYVDPQNGVARRCRLQVLPGTSPFRQALNAEDPVPAWLESMPEPFPLDRITIDGDLPVPEVPEAILAQCHGLGESVMKDVELQHVRGMWCLSFHNLNVGTLHVTLDANGHVDGISLRLSGDVLFDLTDWLVDSNGNVTLDHAWKQLSQRCPLEPT